MKRIKASDVIAEVDYLKQNDYDYKDKLEWLQDVEDRIQIEVLDTHENPDDIQIGKISEETLLTAAVPHTDIYKYYLSAQIDKNNEEFDRYNNNMALYNEAYEEFKRWWHNVYMPISRGNFKI